MKWTLKSITQETNHPFLNYYVLHYEIEKDDKKKYPYSYFIASRKTKKELRALTHEYEQVDGVVIPLYYIDENKEISVLFTRQFRPSMGTYLISFPAGLIDPSDKDILATVKREAKEEVGAIVDDIEILSSGGPTCSGISDEMNSLALARITSFDQQNLEEFEDISFFLVKLKDIPSMFDLREKYLFPLNIKVILLYLLQRFKGQY